MNVQQLIDELQRLQEAEELLRTVLLECGGYGYVIPKMTAKTHARVQNFMKFDDSE